MNIIESKLKNCLLFDFDTYKDERGTFNKLYHEGVFAEKGAKIDIKEQYYSISAKNVLRGMHFQLPPYSHDKLVSCLTGSVLDVVLDLRKDSPTYRQFDSFNLNQDNALALYIPSGMAHGFLSLEDNTIMLYNTSAGYEPKSDKGIHWNSFAFDWPCDQPTISSRDEQQPLFSNFNSPF
jgi:dTDP-4-dehydrorhamnose 3,5-epimerase